LAADAENETLGGGVPQIAGEAGCRGPLAGGVGASAFCGGTLVPHAPAAAEPAPADSEIEAAGNAGFGDIGHV
jgi:hypothetical protein